MVEILTPQFEAESTIRISVVIPTHYRPAQLRTLLDSLDRQTYPRALWEVVVVPSPDDPAFALVEERQGQESRRIRCVGIPGDPWNGRSASAKRNFGVQQATGDWIAFIDDDCFADPDWLVAAVPYMKDLRWTPLSRPKTSLPKLHLAPASPT